MKAKFFRNAMALMMVLAFAVSMAACGSQQSKLGEAPSADGGVQKIKVSVMGPTSTSAQAGPDPDHWSRFGTYQTLMSLFDNAGLELTFNMVAREQYPTVVQTQMAAGTNLSDIVHVGNIDIPTTLNLGYQGIIHDLAPLIDKYSNGNIKAFLDDYDFANKLTVAENGSRYWFVGVSRFIYERTGEITQSSMAQQYRLDWREKLGIAPLRTTEDFLNMLLAFREQDANGNGQQDEMLVITDCGTFLNGIAQWFGLPIELNYADPNTGLVTSPWLSRGMKDYVTFMQRLFDSGAASLDMIGASAEMQNTARFSDKISSQFTYTVVTWENTMDPAFGAKYAPVDPLDAGIGVKSHVIGEVSNIPLARYAITRDCKNPEGAIRFFDVVYSQEYSILMSFGRYGYEWEYGEDGLKTFTEAYGAWGRGVGEGDQTMLLARVFADTVFPRTQLLTAEVQIATIQDYKKEWQLKYGSADDMFYAYSEYYAIPNAETTARKGELLRDLNTYSQEQLTLLCTGATKVEELDNVINELKRLGLEELISINQGLFDRYKAN